MTAITAPVSLSATSGAQLTRLRITRRGRAVVTGLVTAPVVAIVLALALSGGEATATPGQTELPVVTVEAGQTLWHLAESVAPGANPADLIADIISLNGLESAAVMPGQTLIIPERYLD
jgi:LysM repeat protein